MHPGGLGPSPLIYAGPLAVPRALITSSVQHVYSMQELLCNDLAPVACPRLVHKARFSCLFTGMSYGALFYYYGSPMS
jgi:hypothetical protein